MIFARVSDFIEDLIKYHSNGFNILLGNCEPPSIEDIHAVMNIHRPDKPVDFKPTMRYNKTDFEQKIFDLDYFNETVAIAGGWKHITEVSRESRAACPRMWGIVIDHVKYIEACRDRYSSKLDFIATKYRVSPNTIMKYRREFPDTLADTILMTPVV